MTSGSKEIEVSFMVGGGCGQKFSMMSYSYSVVEMPIQGTQ